MQKRTLLGALVALGMFAAGSVAFAQVPPTLSLQGDLTNMQVGLSMNPSITFRIYPSSSGGTAIWSETQTVQLVAAGQSKHFSVILGNINSLDTIAFNKQYWVGLSINGGTELTPRIQLPISPYAVRSHFADTVLSGLADGVVTTAKIHDGAVTTAKLADGAVTSQKIADSTIVNADVSPTAAIAYSKLALTNSIANSDLTANSVTTSKVANGTVTTSKLADSAVSGLKLLTGAVNTAHIADGAVTLPKISTSGASSGLGIIYNGTSVVWGSPTPAGEAGGDLTGSYPNPTVASGAITSAKIADSTIVNADVSPTAAIAYSKLALTNSIQNSDLTANSVTTSKVANGTVTTSKLADSAVSGLKLLTGAVNTVHIADGAVISIKLADGSVLTAKIADAAITTPKIADGAVTSAKIADSTIVNADISPTAAIAYSKLALTNSIQNSDLTANSVTTSKVANGTVTTSKLADSAVSGLKLLTAAVNTAHIADGAVTLPKISTTGASSGLGIVYNGTSVVWGSPTPAGEAGGDLTGSYPNPTVASGAITSAKIADSTIVNADVSPTAAIAYSKLALNNSIQNGDLVANSVTTSKVANGTVTTSKLADSAVSGLKLLTYAVTNRHLAASSVTTDKIDPTGATSGQGLVYNGTTVVWGSPTPAGEAGGDLTGSYPNPTVASGAITSAKIADSTIVNADVSPTAAIAYSKLALNNSIQNGDLVANSVTTSKVANGTVTTSKLADSAVSGLKLLTGAVNTAHIADGAVTLPKINSTGATSGQGLVYNGTSVVWGSPTPAGEAGGDLTGSYPNPTVASGAITSAKIADSTIVNADVSPTAAIAYSKLALNNSIQNGDLVANSVTTSKVANGTVTTSKLADSAVSGLKLLTFAVTNRHLAANSVTLDKVDPAGATNGQVIGYNGTNVAWTTLSTSPTGAAGGDLTGTYPNPTVASGAITSAKIADSTITNADVSPTAAISYSKLSLTNSIQNGDLVANSVTTSKVANGTVTTSKMADSAISGLKLLTYAVTNRHLAANSVTLDKIDPTGATSGQVIGYNGTNVVWTTGGASGAAGGDLTGTYPNPTVANSAITSAKIADSTITNADVSPTAAISYSKLALTNSIQNSDIVANAITTSKVANGTVTTSKLADSAVSGLKLLTYAVTTNHIAPQAVTTDKIDPTGATAGQVLGYDGTNVVWTTATASVNHNATLSGSGTSGSPLGINLGNSNTWTANQTFAGTFLIASNSRIALTNSDNNARDVRFQEPSGSGTQYVGLRAPGVANSGNYVLPAVVGSVGQVLALSASNGVDSATMGWITPSLSGSAGGDLTGTYPNPTISNNTITSAKIADSTITSADISATAAIPYTMLSLTNSIQNGDIVANAITTSKVANGTVTSSKMADSAITGLKLLTYAVTNRHLAANSVTTDKINPTGATTGQVLTYNGTSVVWAAASGGGSPTGSAGGDLSGTYPNPTVANSAITGAKIADSTITSADIAANAAISYTKLSLTNSIQNSDILANAITTSKVANGTVTTSKMADSAISGLKLLTYAVTNRHLALNSVTTDKISPSGATAGQSLVYNGSSVGWAYPAARMVRTTVAGVSGGTTYNATASDEIIGVDVTNGPVVITLPSASSAGVGRVIVIKNELGNAGTNNITINRNGTDLINASSTSVSITFGTATGSFRFYSDGVSRWHQW